MSHLVIIGNGITGVTVARHVRKKDPDMKITMISAESEYFFSRTALMYIFMGQMKYEHTKPYENWFWAKNNIDLVYDFVTEINTNHQELVLGEGRKISYDKLVIATGSKSNEFKCPGRDLPEVQGLYSIQDLDLLEKNTANISRAVIVGGGLIGIELAEMLLSRHIAVTFLVREKYFWDIVLPEQEAKLVSRHIVEHGIDLRLTTELREITAGETGHVNGAITKQNEKIECQFVGFTVGVHPNIDVVKDSDIETNRGVLVNDFLETSVDNVYAAGDCAEIRNPVKGERNKIQQLWYTGRMQGEALAQTLCGKRTVYDSGIWFNSAKFIDIEYQTYGSVSNTPREGEKSLYWEHKNGRHCLRIVYNEDSKAVAGFNLLGIRFRQQVCEGWIRDQKSVQYVLTHLEKAYFDPEFHRRYTNEIINVFNKQNPGVWVQPASKPSFFKRLNA